MLQKRSCQTFPTWDSSAPQPFTLLQATAKDDVLYFTAIHLRVLAYCSSHSPQCTGTWLSSPVTGWPTDAHNQPWYMGPCPGLTDTNIRLDENLASFPLSQRSCELFFTTYPSSSQGFVCLDLGFSCLQVRVSKASMGVSQRALLSGLNCWGSVTAWKPEVWDTPPEPNTRRRPVLASLPPTGFSLPLGDAGLVTPVHSTSKVVWWGQEDNNILVCLHLHIGVPGKSWDCFGLSGLLLESQAGLKNGICPSSITSLRSEQNAGGLSVSLHFFPGHYNFGILLPPVKPSVLLL